MATPKQPLDARTARRVAYLSDNCDERSVQKVARGEAVRGHLDAKIRAALAAEGLLPDDDDDGDGDESDTEDAE